MKHLVQSFYNWYRRTLRHPQYRWLIVGGTLLYLLSPIDISPDLIPILGWIDDGVIVTLLVTELSQIMLENFQRRRESEVRDTPAAATPDSVVIDVDAE
jgi:uncharacterized membrane protein YkvA (DUF1232 family)